MANYYFKLLSKDLILEWKSVAKNCKYSWQDITDEIKLNELTSEKNKYNLIVFKSSSNEPVAIFSSKLEQYTKMFLVFKLKVNCLNTHFNGLFISNNYKSEVDAIIDYFDKIVINYFFQKLSIDYISHIPSPHLILNYPEFLREQILQKNSLKIKLDGLLLNRLGSLTQNQFKKTNRYEIRKGLKVFDEKKYKIEKEKIEYSSFKLLDDYKSNKLNINKTSIEDFRKLKSNKNYEFFLLCSKNYDPIAICIVRIFENIATFYYNSSNLEGRKNYLNKVLMLKVIEDLFRRKFSFFVLGTLYSDFESITQFKKTFSNQIMINNRYLSLISYKSKIFSLFNKIS